MDQIMISDDSLEECDIGRKSEDKSPIIERRASSKAKGSGQEKSNKSLKMPRKEVDLEKEEDMEFEWEKTKVTKGKSKKMDNLGERGKNAGLTTNQKEAVEIITGKFDEKSSANVAEDMLQVLKDAENAKLRFPNIQGALNRKIKLGLHSAIIAIQKLAGRNASDEEDYAKRRCTVLIRESLKKKKEMDIMRTKINKLEEQMKNMREVSLKGREEKNPPPKKESRKENKLPKIRSIEIVQPAFRPPIKGISKRLFDCPRNIELASKSNQKNEEQRREEEVEPVKNVDNDRMTVEEDYCSPLERDSFDSEEWTEVNRKGNKMRRKDVKEEQWRGPKIHNKRLRQQQRREWVIGQKE